jgi:hypothetical protein
MKKPQGERARSRVISLISATITAASTRANAWQGLQSVIAVAVGEQVGDHRI